MQRLTVPGCDRFIRTRWLVSGTTPSFTFSVSGRSVQVYATPADLYTLGIPLSAVSGIDAATLHGALAAASDMIDSALGNIAGLPLTVWGADIRRAAAIIAAYDVLTARGVNPDVDAGVRERYLDIVGRPGMSGWLGQVANGKLTPPGIIDATPNELESGADVATQDLRGW